MAQGRKGRTISDDGIAHYEKIVVALAKIIRLMQEIDEVIEQHGGWPAAFAQGDAKVGEAVAADNVIALPLSQSTAPAYETAPVPLQNVAEPETPLYETGDASAHGATGLDPDDLDREDLIWRIRQMFGNGEERERGAAIDALARELGRQNVGGCVQQDIEEALQIAIGRRILANEGRTLRLAARQIQQYERNLLKDQFLASLSGKPWVEHDDAVRGFARWMGFRRTGRSIDETARSLINGLVREKRLERNGSQIRLAE